MKPWIVRRTDSDSIDYEEYKQVLVRAEDADEALDLVCKRKKMSGFRKDCSNAAVKRLMEDGHRGVILAEFTGA